MEEETNTARGGRFLSFNLGGDFFALEVATVEVVLEMATVTRVPNSPAHVRGVINHRGSVVPVVDLRVLFGQGSTDFHADTSIIVAQFPFEGELLTAGIPADTVHEVLELADSEIESVPKYGSRVDAAFVRGIAKYKDGFIVLLDVEKAVSFGDRRVIEE